MSGETGQASLFEITGNRFTSSLRLASPQTRLWTVFTAALWLFFASVHRPVPQAWFRLILALTDMTAGRMRARARDQSVGSRRLA